MDQHLLGQIGDVAESDHGSWGFNFVAGTHLIARANQGGHISSHVWAAIRLGRFLVFCMKKIWPLALELQESKEGRNGDRSETTRHGIFDEQLPDASHVYLDDHHFPAHAGRASRTGATICVLKETATKMSP